MTKTQAISLMILNKVNEGKDIKTAMKEVIGAERFDAMIEDLYNELRAKAAA